MRTVVLCIVFAASVLADIPSVTVGNTRIQALSPTLLRVEPKGPMGFEDRSTFMVVDRSFPGTPITATATGGKTATWEVSVTGSPSEIIVSDTAGSVLYNSSSTGDSGDSPECNTESEDDCKKSGMVGTCFWDKDEKRCYSLTKSRPNLLHWPSPLKQKAYGLTDYPRFFVPEWNLMPAPDSVDPALKQTNGYDFRNNANGDTYIFLLGSDLDSYNAARGEFIKLAGPCPVLPDFAFGTWFTWWEQFTMEDGKSNVTEWQNQQLPIDVWALDMNWRNTSQDNLHSGEVGSQDHYYDHPNSALFPGDGLYGSSFTEWFAWLRSQKLRTYFNDHPFPVASRNEGGLQTSPEEVAFRWQGLSSWLERGLTYWWFDHNWGFSIPPPFVNQSQTSGNWEGLDNAAWGSHLYYTTAVQVDKVRAGKNDTFYERPLALTKFGLPDWRPGMDPMMHQESPAMHRYPVWWTGDGVPLQGAVESTVNSGVHDFKTYVHSDCGGDYHPSQGGDLLRWTAHCAFSTVFRYHGSDHRPWQYGDGVTSTIRQYLNTRYKLAPSLIAAGQAAAKTGTPFVARCDLFWPEHAADGAGNSTQYIFLEDTLVAPIWTMQTNTSTRSVWVPPGDWEDAWDGTVVTGPKTIQATQPYERQPMWHRKDGGLTILTDSPGLRIQDGNWSSLSLEAFPAQTAKRTRRTLYAQESFIRGEEPATTDIIMTTDGSGEVHFAISESSDTAGRAWVVRVHLRPGQRASGVSVDGDVLEAETVVHLEPLPAEAVYFPFGGAGAHPPAKAGPVVEVRLPSARHARAVVVSLS